MSHDELVEAAYRLLRFGQKSEQEILDGLQALSDESHNIAIFAAQAFLRRDAIEHSKMGHEEAFTALEETATALGVLTKR